MSEKDKPFTPPPGAVSGPTSAEREERARRAGVGRPKYPRLRKAPKPPEPPPDAEPQEETD
jgi:hypothetical protein